MLTKRNYIELVVLMAATILVGVLPQLLSILPIWINVFLSLFVLVFLVDIMTMIYWRQAD